MVRTLVSVATGWPLVGGQSRILMGEEDARQLATATSFWGGCLHLPLHLDLTVVPEVSQLEEGLAQKKERPAVEVKFEVVDC